MRKPDIRIKPSRRLSEDKESSGKPTFAAKLELSLAVVRCRMSLNAQTLTHAREALATADQERQILAVQVREQGKKIVDLENEVQRQANLRSYTEQLLADAKREIEALRAQLPDEATLRAFEDLNRYLVAPEAQRHGLMRIAA